jgi:PAS domain S-box-containing protein
LRCKVLPPSELFSSLLDGTIATWNAAAERIYGYPAEDMIGRPMALLLPPDRANEEEEILARIRRGERVDHFETKRRRKDGSTIDVSLTISPVRDENGRVVGASHVARDVTERRQFEARVHQSQRLASLGVLAGGIAHDFNNLLTGVVANAALIGDLMPPYSPAQPLLENLMASGQRLSDLTRQLLAYAGKGAFDLQPFQLSKLVGEITALIRAATPRAVEIRLELESGLPEIAGDQTQIQQVVMNLIMNASEASDKADGWVSARTYRLEVDGEYIRGVLGPDEVDPGTYVCLEVADNGRGMDEETQAHIFDPFFTTKMKGRGLGLASVLGIVRGHRGVIKVYSEPGHGTSIRVLFPASDGVLLEEALPPQTELHGSGTVLVVDDEDLVRQVACAALERYGYTVLVAEDGRVALMFTDGTRPMWIWWCSTS